METERLDLSQRQNERVNPETLQNVQIDTRYIYRV
jgi:hypothetical protein